jgi:hypothetical protein
MSRTPTADNAVLYRQHAGRLGFRICYVLLGLLALYGLLSGQARGLGHALTGAALYPVTIGIPVLIALLTLWFKDRHGAVTLTPDRLRVGRTTVPVQDLDLTDLLVQAREIPAMAERWAALLASTPLPAERVVGPAPMLGGSYGSSYASAVLTVRLEGLGWRRIDAQRPTELLDALLTARSGGPPQAS